MTDHMTTTTTQLSYDYRMTATHSKGCRVADGVPSGKSHSLQIRPVEHLVEIIRTSVKCEDTHR